MDEENRYSENHSDRNALINRQSERIVEMKVENERLQAQVEAMAAAQIRRTATATDLWNREHSRAEKAERKNETLTRALGKADRLGLEAIHQRNKNMTKAYPEELHAFRELWNSIQERARAADEEEMRDV